MNDNDRRKLSNNKRNENASNNQFQMIWHISHSFFSSYNYIENENGIFSVVDR